jgi:hypothetical protein
MRHCEIHFQRSHPAWISDLKIFCKIIAKAQNIFCCNLAVLKVAFCSSAANWVFQKLFWQKTSRTKEVEEKTDQENKIFQLRLKSDSLAAKSTFFSRGQKEGTRVARFFLVQTYQNVKNIPNDLNVY